MRPEILKIFHVKTSFAGYGTFVTNIVSNKQGDSLAFP